MQLYFHNEYMCKKVSLSVSIGACSGTRFVMLVHFCDYVVCGEP